MSPLVGLNNLPHRPVSVSLSAEEGSFGRRVEAALSSCGGIASTSIETGLEKGFFFSLGDQSRNTIESGNVPSY